MKIGLQVPNFTWNTGTESICGTLEDIARAADEVGFSSLWVMDHFFQIGGNFGKPENEMLEGYSTLAYLAAMTKNVKLGTMVTGVIYRHPGVLVKTVTTLDVLSGGRAYFGIGAGWYEREARALGIPFPPVAERFERLEETLKIALQMWSDNEGPYKGKHYQLAETMNHPQPLSKPHPPILIGGAGEQKTLRLVARYADGCNLFARLGMDGLRQKLEVLKRHCDSENRDYDTIEKTILGTVNIAPGEMTPADMIAQCQELASIGIQQAIFNMPNVQEIKPLEIIGKEVIPVVAEF